VLCSVRDRAQNTQTCSFPIDVCDRQPPTLVCPVLPQLDSAPGKNGLAVTWSLQYSDNAGSEGVTLACSRSDTQGSVPLNCTSSVCTVSSFYLIGTRNIQCSAADASGNINPGCAFSISIVDNEPPQIACPGRMTVSTDLNSATARVAYPIANATDNDAIDSVTCSPVSNSTFAVGVNTVVCFAKDASDNSGTCLFQIEVQDMQFPTVLCPSSVTVNISRALSFWAGTFIVPPATDNLGIRTQTITVGGQIVT
jgi:hypothetical protein